MSEMRDERGSVREVAEPGCAGPGSLIRHRYSGSGRYLLQYRKAIESPDAASP